MNIRNKRFISLGIITIIIGIIVVILFNSDETNKMTYNEFLGEINKENIAKVTMIGENDLEVTTKKDETYLVPNPKKDDFIEFLLLRDIEVNTERSQDVVKILQSFFVLAIIIGAILFIRRDKGKELINDVNDKDNKMSKMVTFDDVAGNIEAKELVKDVIDFIKSPEKYEHIGAKMPRGILLYGPPGTGKTLLAKAIAGEANVPFYAMSGSDFVHMYVGVGANRVRQLFKKARKSEKAVIFIDEIDALGKSRGRNTSSANDEREQTLNALLTEMSGFNDSEGIIVIAATNRVDTLDEALLRPGRFDRKIEVALPDKSARTKIIELYLKGKKVSKELNIEKVAYNTVYFSGAMLENLINESAIIAANDNEYEINIKHVDKAFYTIIAGKEKKETNSSIEEEKRITAYHEAGHALVSKLLLPENRISKVTIIPSTKGAAGFNINIPKDKMYRTKNEIESNIMMLLAGRAAEEIIFGNENVTTGASNDIKKASQELYDYFSKFGMDEDNGLFYLEEVNNDNIIEKCRNKMKEIYNDTKTLIIENQNSLEKIFNALVIKETLDEEEINKLTENITA